MPSKTINGASREIETKWSVWREREREIAGSKRWVGVVDRSIASRGVSRLAYCVGT